MIKIVKNIVSEHSQESHEFDGLLIDFFESNLEEEIHNNYNFKVIINNSILELDKNKKEYWKDLYIDIAEDDDVEIICEPQLAYVVPILINIVITAVITYLLYKFFGPDEESTDRERTMYNFDLSEIRAKKGGVIDEIFGTFVTYPKLIAPIYTRYEGNEQVSYITTAIGKGNYYFQDVYVDKTKVSDIVFDNNKDCEGTQKDKVISCLTPNNNSFKVFRFENYVSSINIDSKYRLLCLESKDLSNFDLLGFSIDYVDSTSEDVYHNISKFTEPVSLNKYGELINKIEIDYSTRSIYFTDSDGDKQKSFIGFFYRIFKYDDFGNKIIQKQGDMRFEGKYTQPKRNTFEIDISSNTDLFIEFADRSDYLDNDADGQLTNNWSIDRIKSLGTSNAINTENITYAVFKIKTGEAFNENNKMNIGLKVERRGLTKMNDVINYIWKSTGYNFLELSDSQDLMSKFEVNGIIDAEDSVFNQMNKILRAQELMLVPTIDGIKVKQDGLKPVKSYVFDKSNIIKNTLEISYKSYDNKKNDGFKSEYFDEEGEKQHFTYPINSVNPKMVPLIGVNKNTDAERHSRIGYMKEREENKIAKFRTSLQGLIPNIGEKVGIAEYYVNNNFASTMIDFKNGKIVLDKEVYIEGGEYSVLKSSKTNINDYFKIINTPNGFTREIELENFDYSILNNDESFVFLIGKENVILQEYVIQEIKPVKNSEVEITAKIYKENVFLGGI